MGLTTDQNNSKNSLIITKRMLHEISEFSQTFDRCETDEQQMTWAGEANQLLSFCCGVEEGSLKGQAAVLIAVQSVWDKLPKLFREKYHNTFWEWAETITGKNQVTLQNHMRAVQIFMIDKVVPSGKIEVIERDKLGKPVLDGKVPRTKFVEWDATTVPMAKLVMIAARAKAGQMTPKLWSVAADSGATWSQLNLAMVEQGENHDNFEMSFYMAGPYLFVKEGNAEAFIGDLSLPPNDDEINLRSTDSLRERALRRLFMMMKIKVESENAKEALAKNGLALYKESLDRN